MIDSFYTADIPLSESTIKLNDTKDLSEAIQNYINKIKMECNIRKEKVKLIDIVYDFCLKYNLPVEVVGDAIAQNPKLKKAIKHETKFKIQRSS